MGGVGFLATGLAVDCFLAGARFLGLAPAFFAPGFARFAPSAYSSIFSSSRFSEGFIRD